VRRHAHARSISAAGGLGLGGWSPVGASREVGLPSSLRVRPVREALSRGRAEKLGGVKGLGFQQCVATGWRGASPDRSSSEVRCDAVLYLGLWRCMTLRWFEGGVSSLTVTGEQTLQKQREADLS
jgi:hypothetical protein